MDEISSQIQAIFNEDEDVVISHDCQLDIMTFVWLLVGDTELAMERTTTFQEQYDHLTSKGCLNPVNTARLAQAMLGSSSHRALYWLDQALSLDRDEAERRKYHSASHDVDALEAYMVGLCTRAP